MRRHTLDLQGNITPKGFRRKKPARAANHVAALLDKRTIPGRIMRDNASVVTMLDSAVLAQVMRRLNLARENGKTNVIAELLILILDKIIWFYRDWKRTSAFPFRARKARNMSHKNPTRLRRYTAQPLAALPPTAAASPCGEKYK